MIPMINKILENKEKINGRGERRCVEG